MIQRINKQFWKAFCSAKPPTEDKKTVVYAMPHPVWNEEALNNVKIDHKEPLTFGDRFAHLFIQSMRVGFDVLSGYRKVFPWQDNIISEKKWINRVLFLETVAGVPGFVAGMHRHLRALRGMKRDNGWIHTLLEEAENERVHLLTFLTIKKPSFIFRSGVILAQLWYVLLYSIAYLIQPRVCHRIVGYLEEEAVKTYTHMIEEIELEGSSISSWKTRPAHPNSIEYWKLAPNATLLDVVKSIRKDEEHHKEVNHKFADDYTQQSNNPFPPGY